MTDSASTSELPKEIAPQQVVYTEIDEGVTSIFEKIKTKPDRQIYVLIPEKAVIFQSLINVKILKRKFSELNKDVSFITTDQTGAYFAQQAGIEVYRNLQLEEFDMQGRPQQESNIDDIVRFRQHRPERRQERQVSISELTGAESNKMSFTDSVRTMWRNLRKRRQKQDMLGQNPQRQAVMFLIGGGVLMLLLVIYIALPHATVVITPNKQIIEQAINVTLADAALNGELLAQDTRRMLPAYQIAPGVITKTIEYKTAGKIFEGTNARGQLTVINEADRAWAFVPRTQFHTPDGLIFRAVGYVNVPAASPTGPGQIVIDVVADEFDTAGNPIGGRGNIGPTDFKVAKLPEESQKLVYGKSTIPMTGGETKTRTLITEADFNNALELAKQQLIDSLPTELTKRLEANTNLPVGLKLLDVPGAIKHGDPESSADTSLIGQEIDKFTVTATVEASGIAFDESKMKSLLKDELLMRESPDRILAQVDDSGIAYRIIGNKEELGMLELTATIKGVEAFDLNPNTQAGNNLLKKVKDHIIGTRLDDAVQYMEGLAEVEKVEVKSWPFWSPNLPSLGDNVKFEIAGYPVSR